MNLPKAARPRRAALIAALCLMASAVGVPTVQAAAERESAGCVLRANTPHKDTLGNTFVLDMHCANLASDLYGRASYNAPVTGRIALSPSWFTCWTEGEAPTGESRIWYYTQGDQVTYRPTLKGWGLVPARVVETQKHPFDGLPRCSWF